MSDLQTELDEILTSYTYQIEKSITMKDFYAKVLPQEKEFALDHILSVIKNRLPKELKSPQLEHTHRVYVGTDVSNWDGTVPVVTDAGSYNTCLADIKQALDIESES